MVFIGSHVMIAGKAKVAVGTIYLYFASKDVLITELFLELDKKIVAKLREGFPTEWPSGKISLPHEGDASLFYRKSAQFRYLNSNITLRTASPCTETGF